jgi:DNA polymerase I
MKPLLVVDGDSFAHRAYHAMPSNEMRRADGGPGNALTGFALMLQRLVAREAPRAVLVAWDTLEVPTYRHRAFAGYQSGRDFDAELLEQLALLPGVVESAGLVSAKTAGYEADDLVAAAAAREEEAGGTCLVATSDRDAYQLASERTTILQPIRGGGEPARIGPAEVRERYGVSPEQVPDFIALRGDPSDRIPGARGIGEKRGAALLQEHGTLEAMLEDGRFEAEAERLRLYRSLATLDRSAPVPPCPDATPDWPGAARNARALGMEGLARRLEAV